MLVCNVCNEQAFLSPANAKCHRPGCSGFIVKLGSRKNIKPSNPVKYVVQSVTWTGDVPAVAAALALQKVHNVLFGVLIIANDEASGKALTKFYQDIEKPSSPKESKILLFILPKDLSANQVAHELGSRQPSADKRKYYINFLQLENLLLSEVSWVHDLLKGVFDSPNKKKPKDQSIHIKELQKIYAAASQAIKKIEDAEIKSLLANLQYSLERNTLFLWVRHSGREGVHYELDTSNTMIRDIFKFLMDSPTVSYQQVVLIGDDVNKTTSNFIYKCLQQNPFKINFIDMTSWWSKIPKDNPFYKQHRLSQLQFWSYIYREQVILNPFVLHIGMRSGQLEQLAYMGFTVNYIDHGTRPDVTRIDKVAIHLRNFQHLSMPPITRKADLYFSYFADDVAKRKLAEQVYEMLLKSSGEPLWEILLTYEKIRGFRQVELMEDKQKEKLIYAINWFIGKTIKPYKDENALQDFFIKTFGECANNALSSIIIINFLWDEIYSHESKINKREKRPLTDREINKALNIVDLNNQLTLQNEFSKLGISSASTDKTNEELYSGFSVRAEVPNLPIQPPPRSISPVQQARRISIAEDNAMRCINRDCPRPGQPVIPMDNETYICQYCNVPII